MRRRNMTIGKRIASGFGFVLFLLCVVVGLSYSGVGRIVENARQVIDGNKLDGMLAQKEVDHLNWADKINALLTDNKVTTLEIETDDHKCGFGRWLYGQERKEAERLAPDLRPMLKRIEAPHRHLHESAIAIKEHFKQGDPELPALFIKLENDHLRWAAGIRDTFLSDSRNLEIETDSTRCALGEWLNSPEAKEIYSNGDEAFRAVWDAMLINHHKLHESAKVIKALLKTSPPKAKEYFNTQTLPLLDTTVKLLVGLREEAEQVLSGMRRANTIYITQTIPFLTAVRETLAEIRQKARNHIMTDETMLEAARKTQRRVTVAGAAAIVAGILFAVFISRKIVAILRYITNQMEQGAGQVASASGQVSSASQSLAEGASEQAASIEETSSALEQMSSMTRQNADHAGQAHLLMNQANQVVIKANDSMRKLILSMDEIAKAGEETSKIIKTIDEIAFQTNLLALNAAVEAARAGEAGAGFAVVADEVRNLAMRAAQAAKSTAHLIEGTIKKVKDGLAIVSLTNGEFSQVSADVAKVRELIGEINAASNEQAQGIVQVNQSVNEVDKVIQQNAANAEESASASEEMNAQAIQMKKIVDHLSALVGGRLAGKIHRKKMHPASGGHARRRTNDKNKKRREPLLPRPLKGVEENLFHDF